MRRQRGAGVGVGPGVGRGGMGRAGVAGVGALAALLCAAQPGCVTEGPPLKPPPKEVPDQPAGIAPDRVLPSASPVLTDSDRNGYVDTISATVYMFARGYDLPVTGVGSFEFELRGANGSVLRTWVIDEAAVRAAEKMFMPGPGYQFDLSLIDTGASAGGVSAGHKAADEMVAQRGDLRTRFVPSGKGQAPIESRSPLTVNLGPAPGGAG